MLTGEDLARKLEAINGRGYKAYRDIAGSYQMSGFILYVDHVQGDPFASPSRLRVRVPQARAGFPATFWANRIRRVAAADFLTREIAASLRRYVRGNRGTGKSGLIAVDEPGQEILERTSVVLEPEFVEARLVAGLPAAGRTILGREAAAMFFTELPRVVEASLLYQNIDREAMAEHVDLAEDQEYVRQQLENLGLVAFVGNGAVLPRASGVSDRPLPRERAVAFQSPPSLEVEVMTLHHGAVRGMGIPKGVTLIVGGGYHGKSTLLRALERGVYPHIPGDGREWVVTDPAAVKIRAEDGRRVERVNITPFITNLPFGQDTEAFSSEDASGSTSQAANIMEALEVGCRVLLVDEDTSATNFMIRDARMQELVSKDHEPITPFVDKVRLLFADYGVSSIIVAGGSGDYLDVADTVIMMEAYQPRDVTSRAQEVAARYPTGRRPEGGQRFGTWSPRVPATNGLEPLRGNRVKLEAKGTDAILFGRETILLGAVEQLVDTSQTRAIAEAIHYAARRYVDGRRSLPQVLEKVMADIEQEGLEVISPFRGQHPGDLARPRIFELAAAINRLRSLRIQTRKGEVSWQHG